MMPNYELRYLKGGKVAHWVSRGTALCGTAPAWYDPDGWWGTGSQEEYEKVAAIPVCKRCANAMTAGTSHDDNA